jgi:hypothetical protein
VRTRELDENERKRLQDVLDRIERAGLTIAARFQADIRVEKGGGGRFPYLTFRAFGKADRHHDPIRHRLASPDCFGAGDDVGEIGRNGDETQI